jgi:type IV pilus assembly protein PilY1
MEKCNDRVQTTDWRVKSSSLNVNYYNPTITYSPWVKGDGTSLEMANFTNVKSNPQPGTEGYNITRNLDGFVYHVWDDTHKFSGNAPNERNSTRLSGKNDVVDWWDEHTRYTISGSSILVDKITYDNNGQETVRRKNTLSGQTVIEIKQNIANWYQYFRRRSFVAKSAIAKVIDENPTYRYGFNFITDAKFPYKTSSRPVQRLIEVPIGSDFQTHNTDIISSLFRFKWGTSGTPLRKGLERAGKYFDNTDGKTNPITASCQKSFAILFTDGYWNGGSPSSAISDSDKDGRSITVADVAHYYYSRDLSGLKDKQNMVTFTVAFGVKGELVDTDGDGWPNPTLTESSVEWGGTNSNINDLKKIDDLWHAAFNSTGKFVSAETPEEVATALANALEDIGNRVGSAAAAAFSTSTLESDSAVFLAEFTGSGSQWTGDVKSFKFDANGQISSTINWSAATELQKKSESNRTIFTYNKTTAKGVPFLWTSIGDEQKNDLRVNPDGSSSLADGDNDAKAKARLLYLRGKRTEEVADNGSKRGTYSFRRRDKLLGDIVHSTPVFVQKPELFWPSSAAPFPTGEGQTYNDFKKGVAKSRQAMVYTGANDGMLHGFNASTGSEVFAYIPNSVFSSKRTEGLHFLTDPDYAHRYYVDMPIVISDAYIRNRNQPEQWRTVLIGGGRKGTRGLFALDITDPAGLSQNSSSATDLVLWEFDHTDDPNLGFTYSEPNVVRLNNGRWAAIFGNGYNSTGDGTASLFIVFLDGAADGKWDEGVGKDYIRITTKAGSNRLTNCGDCNGLSTPQPVDLDADKVVDRVYAGDLQGNMWVFDLSATNAQSWGVAYGSKQNPKPLFIAKHGNKRQPITGKPAIAKHPEAIDGNDPNVLVYFGTGQYLTDQDPANKDIQSFYAVWDHGNDSLTSSTLVEQTFLLGAARTNDTNNKDVTGQVRVWTDKEVNYASKQGWFINLTLENGERVVVDPLVFGGLVFFNTWIPNSDPCGAGGFGFLMNAKVLNGGPTEEAVFDFNGDGKIDSGDLVIIDGKTYAPNARVFNFGLPSEVGLLGTTKDGFIRVVTGTNGGSSTDSVKPPRIRRTGRLSWQELRQ